MPQRSDSPRPPQLGPFPSLRLSFDEKHKKAFAPGELTHYEKMKKCSASGVDAAKEGVTSDDKKLNRSSAGEVFKYKPNFLGKSLNKKQGSQA